MREELLHIKGVDEELANMLIADKITNQESLAELSIDELVEIQKMDRVRASEIIMAARAPWFEEKNTHKI